MTPIEARAAWVAALRSGDYKQVSGELRKGDSFCCLGVACDVYKNNVGGDWTCYEAFDTGLNVEKGKQSYVLPPPVRVWLGLSANYAVTGSSGHLVEEIDGGKTLTDLNDSGRWNFNEIADLIEQGKVQTIA